MSSGTRAKNTSLKSTLNEKALALGFNLCGVAAIDDVELSTAKNHYRQWLERGHAENMQYLHKHEPLKSDPDKLFQGVRSVVSVALSYAEESPPDSPDKALVSMYTRGRDYHEFMKEKLEALAEIIHAETGERSFVFVDSAPVFDRFWASRAGLGWVGKNTCLINRSIGSYFFIGGLLTTLDLAADAPYTDHCGRCRKCIEACPTEAIVEPESGKHYIDTQKCIAYHTIENRGIVPEAVMKKTGRWIAGCDICQQVCPWNDPITAGREFQTTNPAYGASILELAHWSREEFRTKTRGVAMGRIKYGAFLRNVIIAAVNAGIPLPDMKIKLAEIENEVERAGLEGAITYALISPSK